MERYRLEGIKLIDSARALPVFAQLTTSRHEATATELIHRANAYDELREALADLYTHEGETVTNGIGLECDSDTLSSAKAKALTALAKYRGEA